MGMIAYARSFSQDNISGLLKPIIYCCSLNGVTDNAVSINLPLAEKLIACKSSRRTMRIESLFNEVIATFPDGIVIKDFDVMFNPEYKIDVLRIMTVAYKKKPFSIVWPGKYEDGKLFYAKNGYPDYKIFNIDEYDVTCIV